jgi:filamentous hemagglutinin family protein
MLHSKKVWRRCLRLAVFLGIGGVLTELGCAITLTGCFAIAFSEKSALAQIVPDSTLGTENSIVTPNVNIGGGTVDRIDGGAARGANLFHSFSQFNITNGQRLYFANPSGIENILSRVTGNNLSNILGTLGVLGNANLFLINPNGIVFGSNARLDIAGSFVASTANSLVFENGFAFSATAPQAPPLLTINVPIGLQYEGNAGSIQVQGSRLAVPSGETLALVGGNISLDGALLQAAAGRVELGGVTGVGTVGLNVNSNELRLSFPDDVVQTDVSLTNSSSVNVRAGGGGSIAVNAQNLNMAAGSRLQAGIGLRLGSIGSKAGDIEVKATGAISLTGGSSISNGVFGEGDGGNVTIIAGDRISLDGIGRDGFSSGVFSQVIPGAVGNGGNINVITGSISVTNGAQLAADTFGRGNAGSVTITARDRVSLDGVRSDGFSSGVFSQVANGGVGEGGNVTVATGLLSVTNGAVLSVSTFGRGNGGSVTINVRDTATFAGVGSDGFSSGAYTQVGARAVGDGGDIRIATGSLAVIDGAQLSANTSGRGNGGNVTIDARDTVILDEVGSNGRASGVYSQLRDIGIGKGGDIQIATGSILVTNGAVLSVSTSGRGDGGNVRINARDRVSFDGVGSTGDPSGAFSTVRTRAVGNGGTIDMKTESLSLTNGAQLSTSTSGAGDAGGIFIQEADSVLLSNSSISTAVDSGAVGQGGTIDIQAKNLSLIDNAQVSATTISGNGGNIRLQVQDLLLLRRGSKISTTAGTAQAGGDGGNIRISTDLIVAVPKEDSDITANAFEGRGGNINVTTQGIFGIEFRENLTPLSDITASSEFGSDGVVEINTPGVDPSRGLAELPTNVVDPSTQIAQSCPGSGGATASKLSKFIVTGSGGLPASPSEPFRGDAVWHDLRPLTQQTANQPPRTVEPEESATKKLVEAQGWVIGTDGKVILTASTPTVTPHNSGVTPILCPGS